MVVMISLGKFYRLFLFSGPSSRRRDRGRQRLKPDVLQQFEGGRIRGASGRSVLRGVRKNGVQKRCDRRGYLGAYGPGPLGLPSC
eukprot:5146126-Pyramimonas_sp.AAC.1